MATGIPAYEIRPDTWIPPSRAAATGRADLAETMGRKFTAADSGAAFRRQQSRSTIVSMRSTAARMRWVPSYPHDGVLSCSAALSDQHAVCAGDGEVLAARALLDQLRERRDA